MHFTLGDSMTQVDVFNDFLQSTDLTGSDKVLQAQIQKVLVEAQTLEAELQVLEQKQAQLGVLRVKLETLANLALDMIKARQSTDEPVV
jgi:hypothetical protein